MLKRFRVPTGSLSTALVCLALAGCGGATTDPPVAKATGTVTYKGGPVAGATVSFIKEGAARSGVGVTNAEGKFTISTFENNDGALIGDNVVTIVKKSGQETTLAPYNPNETPEERMKKMMEYQKKPPEETTKADELPVKYANPQASGLKAIVSKDSSKNDFKFDLVD